MEEMVVEEIQELLEKENDKALKQYLDQLNISDVEELIDEIILLYKIKRGLDDVKNGDVISWEDFEKEMDLWLQSK